MTSERRNEIENRAISKYGLTSQMNQCIEEMAELTKALCKVRRPNDDDRAAHDNVIEEMADVQIMIDQMRIIFGDTSSQEEYKLNRLWARMEMGE
jgi:NTP pyrophosphatase (non-canonical NTP hydrolase)